MSGLDNVYPNLMDVRNKTIKTIERFSDLEVLKDGNIYQVMVDMISPDSAGIHQPEQILTAFGYKSAARLAKEEFVWDRIENKAQKLAEELNRRLVLDNRRFPNGRFTFGNLESDGSYGLLYIWEPSA